MIHWLFRKRAIEVVAPRRASTKLTPKYEARRRREIAAAMVVAAEKFGTARDHSWITRPMRPDERVMAERGRV